MLKKHIKKGDTISLLMTQEAPLLLIGKNVNGLTTAHPFCSISNGFTEVTDVFPVQMECTDDMYFDVDNSVAILTSAGEIFMKIKAD